MIVMLLSHFCRFKKLEDCLKGIFSNTYSILPGSFFAETETTKYKACSRKTDFRLVLFKQTG